ncbi:sulfite exporter TauE/SafE family protein [Bizionia argentinensis JUB59]|uniref:Probable membrane transporter protein n=1 Tax=Bizionia argentinensis JUB59 TaxID=1046627 RepID=G2EDT4_9FLAO|nr:sulfite exporter TauE/SafE family protein [Bizionia argentinensis]EGV43323.1 sulfite exporter TauE/SafE family protein [Bizionia argentinensis JUB59]
MELFEILGYLSALFLGVFIGLIGVGGFILAVPVLAYLFLFNEKVTTAYALFIVGITSLITGLQQNRKGLVDWRTAIFFGLPAIIGSILVRRYLIPALPVIMFTITDYKFTTRMLIFGIFSILMIPAAFSIWKERNETSYCTLVSYNYKGILIQGFLIGGITGLFGVGGSFLIIPALVMLANIQIKVAVATSFIVIAMNALFGFFIGDVMTMIIDWKFLASFTSISVIGVFIGIYLNDFVNVRKIRKGFGYFVFVLAFFIFYLEILSKSLL